MAGGSVPSALRIVLFWPVAAAIGIAFVVWLFDIVMLDRTLRDIDEVTQFSLLAWALGPLLHWFVLPSDWQRPDFMPWTLAITGISILAAFVVQLGFFAANADFAEYSDFDIYDAVRFFEQFALYAPGSLAPPVVLTTFWMAHMVGYLAGLAMLSWRLAACFGVATATATAVMMLWPAMAFDLALPIDGMVSQLTGAGTETQFFDNAVLVLSGVQGGLIGLAGAVGILVWAFALRRHEEDLVD